MIKYKSKVELELVKHYALKFNDNLTTEILSTGIVKNKEEAIHLSRFFWKMIDASVKDTENNIELPWAESTQIISENVMYSLSGYLERAGYSAEWEEVSDEQDN